MNLTGLFVPPAGRPHFVSHFQYSGDNRLLSQPECDAVLALAEKAGFGEAAIGNPDASRVEKSYRAAKIALLRNEPASAWLYERVHQRVVAANQHFGFDLAGLLEEFQVVQYDAPETPEEHPGHYDWHQDFGADYMSRRKLSMVVQLSEPENYAGCQLTIMDPGPKELSGLYGERGAGVIFPSWMPHCVTPITRGRRHSLVVWVHGHPFR